MECLIVLGGAILIGFGCVYAVQADLLAPDQQSVAVDDFDLSDKIYPTDPIDWGRRRHRRSTLLVEQKPKCQNDKYASHYTMLIGIEPTTPGGRMRHFSLGHGSMKYLAIVS